MLSPDLFSKAHHKSSELDMFLGLSQQPDDGDEKLTDSNDTFSPNVPETAPENSSNLDNSLGMSQQTEDANEKFIAEIAASLKHDSGVFMGGEVEKAPDSPELSIAIPADLL